MINFVVFILLFFLISGPIAAVSIDGSLDKSFGVDGKVRQDFFGRDDFGNAMAVQSDGKIIVAGSAQPPPEASAISSFALVRYNFDGSLDGTFGSGGKVLSDFIDVSGVASGVFDIDIQGDGKIVAVGSARMSSGLTRFVIARYNLNGSLDSGFGTNGKIVSDGNTSESADDVEILPDNKILVVSTAGTGSSIRRYTTSGKLDPTFGVGGAASLDRRFPVATLAIQPDGKILAAGSTVFRLNSDGSLDQTFGSGGKVINDRFFITDVKLQTDGRIVVGGTVAGVGRDNFALGRYNADGSLDTSFGLDGKATTSNGANLESLYIQPDGRIVCGGADFVSNQGPFFVEFVLVRLEQDGSVDNSFGVNGRVGTSFRTPMESEFGGTYSTVMGLGIEPNGRLVAAGYITGDVADFILARYDLGFTIYDKCVQDDSSHAVLQINTITGEYQFTNCSQITINGAGTVSRKGGLITFEHDSGDRRVQAKIDTSSNKATAAVQLISLQTTFTIIDRNTTNNTCGCN